MNEFTKAGDDYCARIYVIFKHATFFWKTELLTYVWSSNQPIGATWPNAYTSNAMTVAVQSGSKNLGRWLSQKRHVSADYRRLFGKDRQVADGVALMTDTDNSGQSATAYYGNIFFYQQIGGSGTIVVATVGQANQRIVPTVGITHLCCFRTIVINHTARII